MHYDILPQLATFLDVGLHLCVTNGPVESTREYGILLGILASLWGFWHPLYLENVL